MTGDIPIATRRAELAEEFERQAEWRWQRLEEYPDDIRNKDAAESLERLAKSVQDCPDDVISCFYEEHERLGVIGSERWSETLSVRPVTLRVG